jgi:hypothetical protein
MGQGFPLRPSRNAFGPKMVDAGEQIRPDTDVGARQFNLSWWQLAGVGITAPLAWVFVSGAGVLSASGEAWNPNADPTLRPVVARTGTGVYTVTYETTYDDEDGTPQPLTLVSGQLSVKSVVANVVGVWSSGLVSGTWVYTVQTTAGATGAPIDAAFELQVR